MNEPAGQVNQKQSRFLYILIIYYTQLDLKSWMIANQKEKLPKPKSNKLSQVLLPVSPSPERDISVRHHSFPAPHTMVLGLAQQKICTHALSQTRILACNEFGSSALWNAKEYDGEDITRNQRKRTKRERERENRGRIPMECAAIVAKKQSNPK